MRARNTTKRRFQRIAAGAALVVAAAGGCSGSSGSAGTGGGDRASNGEIRIDEAKLSGTVTDGQLRIDIPVEALTDASGTLNVALRNVDGSKVLESTHVAYDVASGTTGHLSASFSAPTGVTVQADWVRDNLRIDDGSPRGLRLTTSLLRVVSPYELRLEGPKTLSKGKLVSYRVHAQDPFTRAPRAGQPVELAVEQGKTVVQSHPATTDAQGDAVIPLQIPETGSFTVLARTQAEGTSASLSGGVDVAEPGRKVLLTTDKPVYQPGQTIHLRALALAPPKDTPLAGKTVTFEVEDGKGNKIMKRDLSTDGYGIAATDFTLGRILNLGTFKVRAIVDGTTTEKTVNVSHYALPKFNVGVSVDRPWYGPGDTLSGTLDAGYFFGKPVSGADVTIEGMTLDVGQSVFQRVVGKTDASGKMTFSLKLPASLVGLPLDQGNALVNLRATVIDTAGQQVQKETAVTVAENALQVVAVPEATDLVPGVPNRLQLFASDPLGTPVGGAAVEVSDGGQTLNAKTDAFGYAEVKWIPGQNDGNVDVTVTPESGAPVEKQFTFAEQTGSEHLLVRTDKAVYAVGDTVKVQVVVDHPEAHVYVDWLNDGQAVDMRTLDVTGGVASFTMPVDASLLGTNRVEAYVVDADGNMVRASRTVFARTSAALDVSMTTDKSQYKPGEPAKLTFSVKDEQGNPAVAALGVQVVDQAVFSLIDARPGLLSTYFELEDAYSKPQYEIQAPPGSLSNLLFDKTRSSDPAQAAAAQERAQASLAALGDGSLTGLDLGSWTEVVAKANQILAPYYAAEKRRLTEALRPIALAQIAVLSELGCSPQSYYCQSLNEDYATAFVQRLKNSFAFYDFWGSRYEDDTSPYDGAIRLHSSGPDEKAGTADDADISIAYSDLGLDLQELYPPMTGAAANRGAGTGGTGGTGGASAGGAGGSGAAAPRVRQDFPETLYVNPEVITGPDGKATVDVDMADSITNWRVSALASSADGRLGGGQGGIKVFQDFFADINFPSTLTRGDQVSFPIAVYNYLSTPQTVEVALTPGAWYTALGATTRSVQVGPGQVVGLSFPVRVDQVGVQKLTVTAAGSSASDALARQVLVVPDGKEVSSAQSGSLAAGSVTQSVSFPTNAVAGSQELYVEVYPAFLSQVVTGMDSLLRVPNGCFEQTTSTTWPNVLVDRYMTQTGQITPDIQAKAESLISAGYQRLLTFEHKGGGFSWFGEQDPAPYLSVTAFGLMEFADMAKVQAVDPAMVQRTLSWLVAQQKPDGSWEGDTSEFFTFQTSVLRNTAFVVSALAADHDTGPEVDRGLAFVKSQLGTDDDPYTLGLIANAFADAAPGDPALATVLQDLDQKKHVDGDKVYWDSEGTQTNFYSAGNDAAVAATALVARAMIETGGYKSDADGALDYLTASKDPEGNFGSTQATIWTLRTLLLAAEKGTQGAVGSFEVDVDGKPFQTLSLTQDKPDVMTTVDLKPFATTGSHQVKLSFLGTGKVSYNLVARHNLPWADVPPNPTGPLSIQVSYDKTSLAVNDTVQATVNVVNNTASVQNMAIVTLGIPPGFAVETADLDAYKQSGQLSSYETTGKQLIVYLSALSPNSTATYKYRLRATMPVKASDGGAEVYLYYQPSQKASAPATVLQAN